MTRTAKRSIQHQRRARRGDRFQPFGIPHHRRADRALPVRHHRQLKLNENHSAFFEGNYASTKVDTNIEPFALDSDQVYKPRRPGAGETLVNGVVVKQSAGAAIFV
jgi:hypothetical protein